MPAFGNRHLTSVPEENQQAFFVTVLFSPVNYAKFAKKFR